MTRGPSMLAGGANSRRSAGPVRRLLILGVLAYPVGAICGELVSVSDIATGEVPATNAVSAAASADGRYIAFYADSVAGISSGPFSHIYLRDRQARSTTLASRTPTGGVPNGTSILPSVSADGTIIAYGSQASDIVAGDTNGTFDIYVLDRVSGATTRASVSSAGQQLASGAFATANMLSSDGSTILFVSSQSAMPGFGAGVYTRNWRTGEMRYVGAFPVANSIAPDGSRAVVSLPRDATLAVYDLLSVDVATGLATQVTAAANDHSQNAVQSFNGEVIAFISFATNLVAGDTNGLRDVFTFNRSTSLTARVNLNSSGGQSQGDMYQAPSISADANLVAFESRDDLVGGGPPGVNMRAFVRDIQKGTTLQVSEGFGSQPILAADGRVVIYRGAGRSPGGQVGAGWVLAFVDEILSDGFEDAN